jgi:hypothetical protein
MLTTAAAVMMMMGEMSILRLDQIRIDAGGRVAVPLMRRIGPPLFNSLLLYGRGK